MARMFKLFIFAFLFVCGIFIGFLLILFFSTSSSSLLAPSVVGSTLEDAEVIAKRNNLKLKVQEERYDTKREKGIIIRQTPNGGMSVKKGQTIYVVVSKGIEKVIIPNLEGEQIQKAGVSLLQKSLKLKGASYISSRNESQTVIAQIPLPSTVVPKESECFLLVSQGEKPPLFVMPDLKGKEAGAVMRILSEYGIQCYVENSVSGEGTILRQKPLPGYPVDSSTMVYLGVER